MWLPWFCLKCLEELIMRSLLSSSASLVVILLPHLGARLPALLYSVDEALDGQLVALEAVPFLQLAAGPFASLNKGTDLEKINFDLDYIATGASIGARKFNFPPLF